MTVNPAGLEGVQMIANYMPTVVIMFVGAVVLSAWYVYYLRLLEKKLEQLEKEQDDEFWM